MWIYILYRWQCRFEVQSGLTVSRQRSRPSLAFAFSGGMLLSLVTEVSRWSFRGEHAEAPRMQDSIHACGGEGCTGPHLGRLRPTLPCPPVS